MTLWANKISATMLDRDSGEIGGRSSSLQLLFVPIQEHQCKWLCSVNSIFVNVFFLKALFLGPCKVAAHCCKYLNKRYSGVNWSCLACLELPVVDA